MRNYETSAHLLASVTKIRESLSVTEVIGDK